MPVQHDCAFIFVEPDLCGPAYDQISVPPDALVMIIGREFAEVGFAVDPGVIIRLVILIGSFVRKAAEQARPMFVDLLIRCVEIASPQLGPRTEKRVSLPACWGSFSGLR